MKRRVLHIVTPYGIEVWIPVSWWRQWGPVAIHALILFLCGLGVGYMLGIAQITALVAGR